MIKRTLLGIAALLVATSCVPPRATTRVSAPLATQVFAPRTLLKRLALDVPADQLPSAEEDTAPAPTAPAPAFTGAARTIADADRAVDCLTAAVYYEARSESVDGQRAVAQVVLNRVRDRAFPNSVCGVVYQGSQRSTGCQFSFTCDGSMNRPLEPGAWDRARAVAVAAYGGSVYAPIGSSTYYHATSVLPWWAASLTRVGLIGSHIFYRWRGLMENAFAFRQHYAGVETGRPVRGPEAPVVTPVVTLAAAGYETERTGGVTIHRGSGATATPETTRIAVSSGVRIHVGVAPGLDTARAADPAI